VSTLRGLTTENIILPPHPSILLLLLHLHLLSFSLTTSRLDALYFTYLHSFIPLALFHNSTSRYRFSRLSFFTSLSNHICAKVASRFLTTPFSRSPPLRRYKSKFLNPPFLSILLPFHNTIMKATIVAVAAFLASFAFAQPHHHQHAKHHNKRQEVTWVTEVDYVTETIDVTTTIWVSEGYEPPTSSSFSSTSSLVAAQFFQGDTTSTSSTPSTSASPAPPAPTPTTVSSVYVAPAPAPTPTTSTAAAPVYVAPVESSSTSALVVAPEPPASSSPAITPPAAATSAAPMAAAYTTFPSTGAALPSNDCVDSGCEGDITYYDTAGYSSCGWIVDGTKDPVVALPHVLMGAVSNGNPYCGHFISVTSTATGKSVIAQVVDKCMGCDDYSIDLSHAAFDAIEVEAVGRTGATWHFI
jgi:hypothetical protein